MLSAARSRGASPTRPYTPAMRRFVCVAALLFGFSGDRYAWTVRYRLPVPIEREDYRKAAQGLADAGRAAYKAAQSKNLDAMVEVSGTVADACAACHEVYRDKPEGKQRCIP